MNPKWKRELRLGILAACAALSGGVCAKALGQEKVPNAAASGPASPAGSMPASARFAVRAEQLVQTTPVDKGEWGLLVVDAVTGEVLYEKNADKYFVPASNMKLLTTSLALDKLGPDFRFRTTVETNGKLMEDGTLRGDLFFVGRGDPNLSNRKFPFDVKEEFDGPPERVLAEMADLLVARGLTNRDIAAQLFLSVRTVEVHVDRILTKLGFHSRTQVAAWACARGLLPEDT